MSCGRCATRTRFRSRARGARASSSPSSSRSSSSTRSCSPTFVTDHPLETSPLARKKPGEPELTERFELIITGREIANAFSELIDPVDQRERFEAQIAAKADGRRRGHGVRRGLPACHGVRHASGGWYRHRHRPSGHAADRLRLHPRRPALPAHATRGPSSRLAGTCVSTRQRLQLDVGAHATLLDVSECVGSDSGTLLARIPCARVACPGRPSVRRHRGYSWRLRVY